MFDRFATWVSHASGSAAAFSWALLLIAGWVIGGFWHGWSDTHQLFINTTTTILTFLMVFVIQHTQNKDNMAIHAKLDELIHASQEAREEMVHVESLNEKEIESLRHTFRSLSCGDETDLGFDPDDYPVI